MRTEDLGIEKNLNKTMIVQTSTTGTGPRGAGFYVSYSVKGNRERGRVLTSAVRPM